ncbi:protein BREAST CANCER SUSCEPTIBILITY 1 homolog isoform X2 [Nymphaea colorata]|uniref:protein BREAST CANCER SUSCEPTIBILITY 1 homolog isoform X2 n=1 Tax=Nymphaea colorata TaxID=210225 RepID=UPI00129ED289|nr:protein BREAST CANCER SUSCEPTIBILITY 1 homolog isoform X2 [Nymphaea colorata]
MSKFDPVLSKEFLNPCLLHLEKLAMELKCPICLNLLNQPVLLSCDHILCSCCYLKSTKVDCPVCKSSCSDKELRSVPHMDRLVLIYRGLKAAFEAALLHCNSEPPFSDDYTKEAKVMADIHIVPSGAVTPSSTCKRPGVHGKVTSGLTVGAFTDLNMNQEPDAADVQTELHSRREKASVSRNAPEVSVSNHVMCAFCQSSRETEGSGPMLHYINGRPVSAWGRNGSRVVHVHRKCAEWAPQIYFVDDTIKNLESELARSAKLKCNRCGKKGAALGCLAKSCRRSFHVPCAVEVPDCRWDCENFQMYCPSHSSLNFPGEKTKAGKRSRSSVESPGNGYLTPNQNGRKWTASSDTTKRWVLCGSALTVLEKDCVGEFAKLTGAVISKTWDHNVTHVIASIDENGCCKRTSKVLMAILAGSWVVNINWIKACMEATCPVNEEPYEIDRDIHGCMRGPKIGRQRAMAKEPPLFSGLLFYFIGDYEASYKGSLQDLVLAGGGRLLQNDSCSRSSDDESKSRDSTIIVYSQVYPEGVMEVDSVIEQRLKEAVSLAAETGGKVVSHTWLLDSIAACQLQPTI